MQDSELIIIYSACPSQQIAMDLASTLVEKKLVACVNIIPAVKSVYIWQGQTKNHEEALLIMKTQRDRFNAISEYINKEHPYELPEVVAVSISDGSPPYLSWINEAVKRQ